MMFSATFPPAIQRLSAEILKPDFVMVSNKKLVATNSRVEQRFISVTSDNKKNALLELFQNQLAEAKKNNRMYSLVYFNYDQFL